MLKLTEAEKKRLKALCAGHGNRSGTGIFPGTRKNQKITPKQLRELKELKNKGWTNKPIRIKLDLSEYIVRMGMDGHYDHILPLEERK